MSTTVAATMKLYEVTNGYTGESYVRCIAIAESAEAALELARPVFQKAGGRYGDSYWRELRAECLCKCTGKPWCGEVRDG